MKKIFLKILLFITILIVLSGCTSQKQITKIESTSQLNGLDIGCMSGSIFDELIAEQFPDSKIIYFTSRSELLLALTSGKISSFISDEPVAMMMKTQNEAVDYLDEEVGSVEYGICFSDSNKDKLIQFNQFLSQISTNGHLEQLQDKWISPDGAKQKKETYELSGENGTLRCVTTPDAAPFSFIADNIFEGYEVELLYEFAHEYGYDLEINTVSFDALLTSVAMDKYDIAFNGIYITEERAKSVNFCDPVYKARDVAMIHTGNSTQNKDIFTSIKESFYKNFIEEDRYKILLSGVFTTLMISIFSIIDGTFFGLSLYMLSSMNPYFKKIADAVQKIMAKLPAVVILMMLFYVVFKTSSIDATLVSIIGFSFIFGNTFYNLLKTGVKSIDYGQSEAAMALGYEKWPSFFRIILPQALKIIYQPYISEIISLIKNTSIVGYVSVNDVTRSSDIIRGRTYDALFPLIVTAIIYYLLCTLLTYLVSKPLKAYIEKKVNYDDQI